jgi:hypothetical protein
MPPASPARLLGAATSRRIGFLTLALGTAAAVVVSIAKSRSFGAGLFIGTVLAWLNYRWLEDALAALERVATAQEGSVEARVPPSIYPKIAGRYVLIAAAIYVSVHYFRIPVVALIVGLLALGAGAIVASLYEVIFGEK